MATKMIETSYKIIKLIEKNPEYTQRKIAKASGYSLGKVNYIIASLTGKNYGRGKIWVSQKRRY